MLALEARQELLQASIGIGNRVEIVGIDSRIPKCYAFHPPEWSVGGQRDHKPDLVTRGQKNTKTRTTVGTL